MKYKVIRIVKQITIVVLTLAIIMFFANEIVFRISASKDFQESNWTGKWNSLDYSFVSGRMLTSIPENIKEQNIEFKSKVLLYYNLWSIYKPGQVKVVELSGEFGQLDINGKNEVAKEDIVNDEIPYFFKAKLTFGQGQFITYKGYFNHLRTEVSGEYDSSFPDDKGIFKLNKE
jgi:hypothetical protein